MSAFFRSLLLLVACSVVLAACGAAPDPVTGDVSQADTTCGGLNQACCANADAGAPCQSGMVCQYGATCRACGNAFDPCCAGNVCNDPSATCINSGGGSTYCRPPCGYYGGPCCSTSPVCYQGGICWAGTCYAQE